MKKPIEITIAKPFSLFVQTTMITISKINYRHLFLKVRPLRHTVGTLMVGAFCYYFTSGHKRPDLYVRKITICVGT